jgi:hypothetical protein
MPLLISEKSKGLFKENKLSKMFIVIIIIIGKTALFGHSLP